MFRKIVKDTQTLFEFRNASLPKFEHKIADTLKGTKTLFSYVVQFGRDM